VIVHLNGMPGVGKYTVAKRLREIIPARLIDNHLIIDLVESICGGRSSDYTRMLAAISEVVYSLIAQTSADEIILFTNALASGVPEDEARLGAVKELARRMHTPFVPILLTCEAAENERRLLMPDRSAKGKLMDARNLRELIVKYQIAHYPQHPNALQIDTSTLSAEQAANKIVEHLKSCTALEG
jgi:hypothetical protein